MNGQIISSSFIWGGGTILFITHLSYFNAGKVVINVKIYRYTKGNNLSGLYDAGQLGSVKVRYEHIEQNKNSKTRNFPMLIVLELLNATNNVIAQANIYMYKYVTPLSCIIYYFSISTLSA